MRNVHLVLDIVLDVSVICVWFKLVDCCCLYGADEEGYYLYPQPSSKLSPQQIITAKLHWLMQF